MMTKKRWIASAILWSLVIAYVVSAMIETQS